MNDLISRQAAIDAYIKYTIDYYLSGGLKRRPVTGILRDLPSAQQWIPCSERLPEEYGVYLVTKHTIGWNCEEYDVTDIAYFDDDGFHKADRVIAWMPLPEPYEP